MQKKFVNVLFLSVSLGFLSASVACAENNKIVIDADKSVNMAISIYNNGMGFVRDVREIELERGSNLIAFQGVPEQINPESAMLTGEGVSVKEQNYNYNLLNSCNLVENMVGETVKTARFDEKTGKDIFNTAKIIDSVSCRPVLQFDYGVETEFPGRIIYEKLPKNLITKPTLDMRLRNKTPGKKKLQLAYLTNGIKWNAAYVAEVGKDNVMNLNGWVTIDNKSGADFENVSVQLVSGSVNTVQPVAMPRMYALSMKAAVSDASLPENAVGGIVPEALGDYYLYELPKRVDVKNNQSKQISLFEKENVRFDRVYKATSPLYAGLNLRENEFENNHPEVVFKLTNSEASGLGLPLPQGVVRLYEKDAKGNMLFVGESSFPQLAKGGKAELVSGKSFDVALNGKLRNVTKLSKESFEADFEITLKNAKNESVKVEFEQVFNGNWEIVSESQASEKKNASTALWHVEIPANGEKVLTFKSRITAL